MEVMTRIDECLTVGEPVLGQFPFVDAAVLEPYFRLDAAVIVFVFLGLVHLKLP